MRRCCAAVRTEDFSIVARLSCPASGLGGMLAGDHALKHLAINASFRATVPMTSPRASVAAYKAAPGPRAMDSTPLHDDALKIVLRGPDKGDRFASSDGQIDPHFQCNGELFRG